MINSIYLKFRLNMFFKLKVKLNQKIRVKIKCLKEQSKKTIELKPLSYFNILIRGKIKTEETIYHNILRIIEALSLF